jgi:hypothetical protein
MTFRVTTVQDKKNPKARPAILGAILLVVSVFLAMIRGYEKFAIAGFFVAICFLLYGAIRAKGDLTDYGVSDIPLTVTRELIRVGESTYTMNLVKDLNFAVKGFAGMSINSIGLPAGASSDGMDNYLRFEYMAETVNIRFYLADAADVQALGLLFRDFYEGHVAFIEQLNGYPSFMLQPMSDKEIRDAKMVNGY